ncbi:MAG TPA: M20 family metallopeptidase [Acidimicrobiia bacterium]
MDAKQAAAQAFEAVEGDLRQISRWLYENPEVAYEEHESSHRLVEFMTANGFEVEYPAYGLATSFAARAGSDGPEVIICAEYDALPEVGHACGHNIIATAACGAGVALRDAADQLGFRVTVLGTPAEEAYGGKVDLIEAGAFSGAAAAMMVHPSVRDEVDPGVLAVAHVDVEFHGKESHAAFAPEKGINALDAAVQAYVNVSTLRQTLLATDRVHGVITYGGGAPNVVPPFTSMAWYVRSATRSRLDELYPRVLSCFEAAAIATGCKHEVHQRGHLYTDMVSDSLLADLYAANSEAMGRPMHRRGSDPPLGGSTDMGNVSHEVPTIHPMLDIQSLPAVNHQREFAAHTITPAGERAIRDGALGMAYTVIDVAGPGRWDELGSPVAVG